MQTTLPFSSDANTEWKLPAQSAVPSHPCEGCGRVGGVSNGTRENS